MNRFRQLKQKLIKGKRDSQKITSIQKTQQQLTTWIQSQLEYYGIKKQSYKLSQLKSFAHINDKNLDNQKVNSKQQKKKAYAIKQNQTLDNYHIQHKNQSNVFDKQNQTIKQKCFQKKVGYCPLAQINSQRQQITFGGQKQIQQVILQQLVVQSCNYKSSKSLIRKKPTHSYSTNDIPSVPNNKKAIQQQHFHSNNAQHQSAIPKQLDYYTLILQLTAQLNYSRLNKQYSNQKSILKQIKNLIEYIQGENNMKNRQHKSSIEVDYCKAIRTSTKSNHTFSSICSNQAISQQNQFNFALLDEDSKSRQSHQQNLKSIEPHLKSLQSQSQNSQPKIKYKIIRQDDALPIRSFNQYQQDQRVFDQNNAHNGSIIDEVNNIDMQQCLISDIYSRQLDLQVKDQNHEQSMIQNSPLSRITQHQSEYTQSLTPSCQPSPQKPSKLISWCINSQQNQQQSITISLSQKSLKKPLSIGQRLQCQKNLFEQSLEYRKILYMLDCQYEGMGRGWGKESQEEKSFFNEVFQSNQEDNHVYIDQNRCLINNLEQLFKGNTSIRTQKSIKNPQFIKNKTRQSYKKQVKQLINEKPKNLMRHQRSKTNFQKHPIYDCNNQIFNQNPNQSELVTHNLSQQFPNQTFYQSSQSQSIYCKPKRNSYLTLDENKSPSQTEIISIQNQFNQELFIKRPILKQNIKQEKKTLKERSKPRFIVKKKNHQNNQIIHQFINQNSLEQVISYHFSTTNLTNKQGMKSQKIQQIILSENIQQSMIQNHQPKQLTIQRVQSHTISNTSQDSTTSNKPSKSFKKSKSGIQSNSTTSHKSSNSSISINSQKSQNNKTSLLSSSRQIKYKVTSFNQKQNHSTQTKTKSKSKINNNGVGKENDKRKVLTNIVQMLNHKYQKKIHIN